MGRIREILRYVQNMKYCEELHTEWLKLSFFRREILINSINDVEKFSSADLDPLFYHFSNISFPEGMCFKEKTCFLLS